MLPFAFHAERWLSWPDVPDQWLLPLDPSAPPAVTLLTSPPDTEPPAQPPAQPPAPSAPLLARLPAQARALADDRWQRLRRQFAGLYDGPCLAVTELFDSHIALRPAGFRAFVVQFPADGDPNPPPTIAHDPPRDTPDRPSAAVSLDLGLRLLGVKALITARSPGSNEHDLLLLARRSSQTRIYQGMWESAPAGTLDTPDTAHAPTALDLARAAIRREADEELALDLSRGVGAAALAAAALPALVADEFARSVDLLLHLPWPEVIDPERRAGSPLTPACRLREADGEYLDAQWLTRAAAPDFVTRHRHAIVGPTLAALRFLGWAP